MGKYIYFPSIHGLLPASATLQHWRVFLHSLFLLADGNDHENVNVILYIQRGMSWQCHVTSQHSMAWHFGAKSPDLIRSDWWFYTCRFYVLVTTESEVLLAWYLLRGSCQDGCWVARHTNIDLVPNFIFYPSVSRVAQNQQQACVCERVDISFQVCHKKPHWIYFSGWSYKC